MMVAIHESTWSFAPDWVQYCLENDIDFKKISGYSNDIIEKIQDCDFFLWHHHHTLYKDKLVAQRLLFALEQAGIAVFPNFNTSWYFDDKLAQKYLLEAIQAPLVKTFAFYDQKTALDWAKTTKYPKVFKLKGGAGSNNVVLVPDYSEAKRLIFKAFGSGFKPYNRWVDLKENLRRYFLNKNSTFEVIKSIRRFFTGTEYSKMTGNEKGYVLFQKFIPNNDSDIRVVTIGSRAFAIKRPVRKNDFRASGSGFILYDKSEIDKRCVQIAFETTKKLKAQCLAYDFVFDENNQPLIVEINYGFAHKAYDPCPGYWDEHLQWHETKICPTKWMLEDLINNKK